MRNSIRSLVLVLALTTSTQVGAQIPVTDIASLFKQISIQIARVAEWYKQYQRWQEQFRRWQKQYDAITGEWNRLTQGGLDPAVLLAMRDTFPPELQDFMDQNGGLFGTMQADYQRLRTQISSLPADYYPAASELANQLETTLDTIAKQQATADTAYRASRENLKTANELRYAVQGAGTLKNATDLNARINAELLAVQSEANRLQTIAMRKEADKEREGQQRQEMFYGAMMRRTPSVTY